MRAIADTGPLVAYFDRRERRHDWAAAQIELLEAPLLVCEAVLAEAMYLLSEHPKAQDALMGFIDNGALQIGLRLEEHVAALRKLLTKYRDAPMSLADACVVRMAEIHNGHAVFTLDSDFLVYRMRGKEPLSLVRPEES